MCAVQCSMMIPQQFLKKDSSHKHFFKNFRTVPSTELTRVLLIALAAECTDLSGVTLAD